MGQENFSDLQASTAKFLQRPVTWDRLVATDNGWAGMKPLPGEEKTGEIPVWQNHGTRILLGAVAGAAVLTGAGVILENMAHQTPHAAASDPARCQTYIVQPGDNLNNIGLKFHEPWQTIATDNPQIINPRLIYPGQIIKVLCDVGGPELLAGSVTTQDLIESPKMKGYSVADVGQKIDERIGDCFDLMRELGPSTLPSEKVVTTYVMEGDIRFAKVTTSENIVLVVASFDEECKLNSAASINISPAPKKEQKIQMPKDSTDDHTWIFFTKKPGNEGGVLNVKLGSKSTGVLSELKRLYTEIPSSQGLDFHN